MNKQNVLMLSLCFSFAGIASDGSEYGGEMSYLDERDLNTIQKLEALDRRQVSAQAVLPGQVIFTYGSGIPTVVCALFEITDISMEKGEILPAGLSTVQYPAVELTEPSILWSKLWITDLKPPLS